MFAGLSHGQRLRGNKGDRNSSASAGESSQNVGAGRAAVGLAAPRLGGCSRDKQLHAVDGPEKDLVECVEAVLRCNDLKEEGRLTPASFV